MPIYDFTCTDCGNKFEQICSASKDVKLTCPVCGSDSLNRLISSPGLIRTEKSGQSGHTCCGRTERCDRPPCSSDGQCHK